MPLTPMTVERFGGLNLLDDPLEVGASAATDGSNFWLDHGRVGPVPQIIGFGTATRKVQRLYNHANLHILASESDGVNTTLQGFSAGGASIATTTFASANTTPFAFASVGTSSTSRAYATRAGDGAYRWDGSAWTAIAAIPNARFAAPADNGTRLAVANNAGSSASRVWFSSATDSESFNTADPGGDWVDVAPGDGESVVGLIAWRGLLFAFKNTKFAVFYSTSVDSDGGAIFNYRIVEGRGMTGTSGALPCATADGVYFMAPDGVYVTTGGPAVLVSRAIAPLWNAGGAPPSGSVTQLPTSPSHALGAVGNDVYLTAAASSKMQTFVLRDGEWMYLTIQANGSTTDYGNVISGTYGVPVYTVAGSTSIKYLSPADGPDPSLAWSYKSGRYALADPGHVAVARETSLVGAGTVTLALASDLYSSQSASATLGTYPAAAEGWPSPVDQEGTWMQYTLSGTGTGYVSRLTHHISSVKPAGVR